MKKYCFDYYLAALLVLLLAACGAEDVYQGEDNPDTPVADNGKLTGLPIPDDFDWSTTQQVKVTLAHTQEVPTDVKIYASAPGEGTLPVAAGIISPTEPYQTTLTLPATQQDVTVVTSVRYRDGARAISSTTLSIVEGKVTWSGAAKASTRASKSGTATFSPDKNWSTWPELGSTYESGKSYQVPAGKTVEISSTDHSATIYVAGTLILPDNFKVHQDFTLVILGPEQTGTEEGGLVMGKTMWIMNGFKLYNYGKIDLTGTLTVGNGASVETYGCIFADELIIDENGKDDLDYIIHDGGCTRVNNMTMNGTKLEMGANAILEVKETLTLQHSSVVNGNESTDYAVIKTGNVAIESNSKLTTISDKIYVVCDNQPTPPDRITVDGNTGAIWGNTDNAAKDKVVIPPTHCSDGFNPGENTSGVDPEPETTVTSTGVYTYAFEDQWPSLGDYDMNDLILRVEALTTLKGNQVEQMELKCAICGIGASYRIAAAMQWEGVAATDIGSVTHSESNALTRDLFILSANGTEKDQPFAVVPLFDDAHALAQTQGISGTRPDQAKLTKTFSVTLRPLSGKVTAESAVLGKLNFFICCNAQSGLRMEIHLVDGQPTNLFDTLLVGKDVSSVSTPFKAKGNYCWAMLIPGEFRFPLESNDVRQSYEEFDQWISNSSYDWYNHPIEGKVK